MRYDLPPQLIMTYCERVGVLPSVVCRLANRSAFIIIRTWIGLGQFYRRGHPGQPNMEAALGDLRAARASLQKAVPDKAGHRNKAIGLVDQAIAEVQAGMVAALWFSPSLRD